MRIVHIAAFSGHPSAGFATTTRKLGEGYISAGHEFGVVGPGRGESRSATDAGIRIDIPWPLRGTVRGPRAVGTAVRRVLEELAPDRLEVSDRLMLRQLAPWAQSRGVPAVLFSQPPSADWVLRLAKQDGSPVQDYDRLICMTARAAREFEPTMPGRVSRLDRGVDLETFSPQRWSAEVRREILGEDSVLLLTVGRLSARKAPQRSIEVLRLLRDRGIAARLIFVGSGPLLARLERQAARLPVFFVGQVTDRRELAILMASSDVMLSHGAVEGLGLAALEALASGTPVVGEAGSGIADLLDGDGGELAPATADGFADAVSRILARRVEVRRTEARSQAIPLPWQRSINSMLALHESLGGSSGSR